MKRTERKPDDYRITLRLPKELGAFIGEYAYRQRSTITFEIQQLIQALADENPEILEEALRRAQEDS